MTDVRAELTARFNRAINDGSKVIAINAVLPLINQLAAEHDRARMVADDLAEGIARLTGTELDGEDPWGTALAASYADTWDGTPPAADIRTPGWPT